MKRSLVQIFVCLFGLFFGTCFGQSSIGFDLDHIMPISKAHFVSDVHNRKDGQVIELIYWVHGCDMMKPMQRTLVLEKSPSEYVFRFCDLTVHMGEMDLIPIH